MKNLSRIILLILAMALVFALASCDFINGIVGGDDEPAKVDYQAILNNYLLEKDGKTVSEDFVLPKSINGNAVTWTSDNAAITLEERADDYLAKIVLPENRADVTLTVKLGDATKNFTVSVNPVDVYSFLDSYNFIQDKQLVVESFALDQSCSFKGYTASITWSIDAEYADYAEISADGKTCVVYPNSLNPSVAIKATFKYKEETATKTFKITVSLPMSELETIDYWYNNTGVSVDMKGYILAVGTVYSEEFGNVTLYIVDESLKAGYYLYRLKMDAANAALIAPGNYITVTGTTNTNYNGLIETNAGGNGVIDASKTIDINTTYYAIDNDLFANSPATIYNESRFVTLSGWTVKSIAAAPAAGANADLAVLEKNGAEITLRVSKYLEGAYLTKESDPVWNGIIGLQSTLKVGDIVDVKGIFSKYQDKWQLMPLSAADVVVTEADAPETTYAGLDAKDEIANAIKAIEASGLKSLVTSNMTVALPASGEKVTIAYRLCSESKAIVLDGNNLTVTPGKDERVNVEVTFTCGDYTTNYYFKIHSIKKTDAEMAEAEAKEVTIDNLPSGAHELAIVPKTFKNVTFTFAPAEGFEDLVSFKGNTMYLIAVDELTPVTVLVTAHSGDESFTASVNFSIKVPSFTKFTVNEAPSTEKVYKAGLFHATNNAWMFSTGKNDGNFGAADVDYTKGADFGFEAVDGGYYVFCTVAGVKKYMNMIASNDYTNVVFEDAASTVWTWNADHDTVTSTVGGHTTASKDGIYYVGAYGTNKTFSTSMDSYLKSCDIDGATSFCLKFYTVEEDNTDTAGRALAEKNAFKVKESYSEETVISCAANQYADVQITFALAEACDFASIDENGDLVLSAADEDYTVHLNVTFTCGKKVEEASYEIKFVAPAKYEMPLVGVGYKFFTYQANLSKNLYADGTFGDRYLNTTDDASKAPDFYIIAADGGYYIAMYDDQAKQLNLELYTNSSNKVALRFSETGSIWSWNSNLGVFSATLGGKVYYVGTYSTFNTFSASETSYISGANAANVGVSQFPAKLAKVMPAVDTELLFALDQNNAAVAKTLYFAGKKDGNFFATVDDPALATKVTIEAVDGGYRFFFMDGETKKYLDIYEYAAGKVGVELNVEPHAVYTWDETYGFFYAHVLTYDKYLGTYNNFKTISASDTYRITGEKFADWGVSQYPCYFTEVPAVEEKDPAEKIAAEKDALSLIASASADKTIALSVKGATYEDVAIAWEIVSGACATISEGNLVITIPAAAEDIVVKATLSCGEASDTKEFTIHAEKPSEINDADHPYSVEKALELTATLEDGATSEEKYYFSGVVGEVYNEQYFDFYLENGDASIIVYGLWQGKIDNAHRYGTKDGFLGLPAINTGDTVVLYGNLQKYMKSGVATPEITNALLIAPATDVAVTVEAPNATVNAPETATNGTSLSFTVAPADGYEIVSVKAYGEILTADNGTYSVTVAGPVKIVVATKEAGAVAKLDATLTFPDDNSASNKIGAYDKTWTAKIGDQEYTIFGFNNNNWGWTLIKCGRKADPSVASITTTFAEKVTKVTLTVDTILKADAVNSIKLEVKDSQGTLLETVSVAVASGDLVFNLTKSDSNCTYSIIIDNAVHGSKNGNVAISAVHYEG